MKYLKQLCIILLISFAGEVLSIVIPAPIPASIYGIVILFGGLVSGIIPLGAVKETGKFLVEIMPVMFIPAGVGLINAWDIMKPSIIQYAVVTLMTTIFVMAAAGRVTQWICRRGKKNV